MSASYHPPSPRGGYYLCDGQRNIRHQTNFQEFLVKYFGFRYAYTRENFFSDNYPPIVENGVLLKDMQVLSLEM